MSAGQGRLRWFTGPSAQPSPRRLGVPGRRPVAPPRPIGYAGPVATARPALALLPRDHLRVADRPRIVCVSRRPGPRYFASALGVPDPLPYLGGPADRSACSPSSRLKAARARTGSAPFHSSVLAASPACHTRACPSASADRGADAGEVGLADPLELGVQPADLGVGLQLLPLGRRARPPLAAPAAPASSRSTSAVNSPTDLPTSASVPSRLWLALAVGGLHTAAR